MTTSATNDLNAVSPETSDTAVASGEAARVPSILLVDDEPNVLSALRRVFRPTGYDIATADSGEAALEILASTDIDLIVSDMRMPHMSGAEFLARA
ncbi:response regulator, partial [Burkholderia cenocepacia]